DGESAAGIPRPLDGWDPTATRSLSKKRVLLEISLSDWCSVPSAGFAGAICLGGRFGRGAESTSERTTTTASSRVGAANSRPPSNPGLASGRVPITRADSPGSQPSDEGVAVDAEAAGRPTLVPVFALQRAQHVGLFESVPRFFQAERR